MKKKQAAREIRSSLLIKMKHLPLNNPVEDYCNNSRNVPRICMLIPSFHPIVGGAERQAIQLSCTLVDMGLKVFIVTRRLKATEKFEVLNGVPVHRTFYKWHMLSFIFSALFFLIKKRHEYDILHVHTMYSPALMGCLIKKIFRKKLLIKVRRTGHGSLLEKMLSNGVSSSHLRFLIRYTDCFVTVNQEGRRDLEEAGVERERVRWIPNAVDKNLFKTPTEDEKNHLKESLGLEERLAVSFVGRLIPRKKVDSIINVLPPIIEYFPKTRVLIVGDGPESQRLKEMAELRDILQYVDFAGQCNEEMVMKYLKASDLFIFPSDSEGISNALLEAMAMGLPIVASRISGIEDLITNGHSGLLFHPGDENDLLEKVLLTLGDKQLRRKIGEGARQAAENRFSFDSIGKEYIDLYSNLTQHIQRETCGEKYIRKWKDTKDKRYLKAYYSRPEYKSIYEKPKRKWIKKFEVLVDMMSLQPGERVLDVGCASKMLKPFVEKTGAIYKGVDISESFEPDYVCDAEDMSIIPDHSFDFVVLSDILEHLPYSEKAIMESGRIGRKVISVVPNWYRLERFKFLPRSPDDRHLVRKSPREWIKEFERAGFKICCIKGYYYVPSIAFYPIKPLKGIDLIFRTKPFEYISLFFDKHLSAKPAFRFMGQELIIVAKRDGEIPSYNIRET